MWAEMDAAARARLARDGEVALPSDYGDEPYPITRRLIEDGRANLVLRAPLALPFPVRLLHGDADRDVPLAVALRLLAHATADDMRLTIVKGADHRFSAPDNLALVAASIEEHARRRRRLSASPGLASRCDSTRGESGPGRDSGGGAAGTLLGPPRPGACRPAVPGGRMGIRPGLRPGAKASLSLP